MAAVQLALSLMLGFLSKLVRTGLKKVGSFGK